MGWRLALHAVGAAILIGWHSLLPADTMKQSEILVIAHENAPVANLSRKQVMGFFLGRLNHFPAGGLVKVYDLPLDSPTRTAFFETLTGKPIVDIDAYWARLKYSGRSTPPQIVDSSAAAIQEVLSNEAAIAYVKADQFRELDTQGARVLFSLQPQ